MGRMDKVNSQMKREISLIIQRELGDPRLQFVTITHVEVSPDLRNAKVHYSFLGDVKSVDDIQKGLDGARGMIRKLVGQQMKIRYNPELSFHFDRSIEESLRIEKTLKEIEDVQKGDQSDQEA